MTENGPVSSHHPDGELHVPYTEDDVLAQVFDGHAVVRDGSFWTCRFCKQQWPYPSPVPADVQPCVPRKWGER